MCEDILKNRANDVAALIDNFDTAIQMAETAENSAGSAAAENAKYVDSLQGKLDIMKASIQAFSNTALESDFLKGGVDIVTGIIDAFTKLIDVVGGFPALLGAGAAAFSLFNKGIVTVGKTSDGVTKQIKFFGQSVSEIKGMLSELWNSKSLTKALTFDGEDVFAGFKDRLDKDKQDLSSYIEKLSLDDTDGASKIFAESSSFVQEYISSTDEGTRSVQDFSEAQKEQFVQLHASNKGFKSSAIIINEYNDGCKKVGMTQQGFTNSIKEVNPVMAKYLSDLNGSKATMGGYIASLVGAKFATIALEAATMALNMALTMGIGVAIGAVITGISSLINHYDDLAESVDESSNAFNESNSSLMKNSKGFKEAAKIYDELKHGVNSVGENIGLSTDEFDRYHDAVNQIAELAPSLVSGFDSQGNAILNNVSSVNELTDAYADLIAAESKAFIEGDEENGYAGAKKVAEDYIHEMNSATDLKIHRYDKAENDLLKELIDGTKTVDDLKDSEIHDISKKLGLELESGGFWGTTDYEKSADNLEKHIKENVSEMKQLVGEYDSEYQSIANSMKDAATAFLNTELYDKDNPIFDMSDSIKNSLSQYVGNLDQDFFEGIYNEAGGNADKAVELLESKISGVVSKFAEMNASQQKQLEEAFNLKSDFDSGEINMKEFSDKVGAIDKMLDDLGLDSEEKKQFMVSLGFEYDGDGNLKTFTKEYEAALARFGGDKASKEVKNWLETLSGQDLNIVANMELTGEESIDRLQELLDLEKALQNVDKIDINVETESLEKLNAALKESTDATGLTQESIEAVKSRYADLDGFDAAAIFEKTTTGVRLNTEALNSLEEQYINTKKAANDQNLSTLAKEYQRLGEEIESAKKAGDSKSVDDLTSRQTAISDAIKEAQMLASAYDGMTSSYKQWLDAQSGGQEGDRYASILSGRENAVKLANAGKWGNTELQNYVEMFTSPDVDLDTPQQYADAWGSAIGKSKRYFQEGRDGITNFMSDVHKANGDLVTMNSDGSFNIQPGFDTKDFAKAAGVAESTVESIFGMMSEYGFDVPIGIDEMSVDELVKQSNDAAKKASDALKSSLGDDFEIEVKTDIKNADEANAEIERLKAQRDEINNSDATVEVKQQGIDAVNAAIESAIMKKIELEQPAFMKLDDSQVKSTMTEALAALKQYQTAVNEVSRLDGLQGAGVEIDTAELDAAKAKVDETAAAIAKLPDEVKVGIGLEASDGADAIKKKISEGKVTLSVDTDVDKTATEELKSNIEKIESKDITITAKVDGADEVRKLADSLEIVSDVGERAENMSQFADAVNQLKDLGGETEVRLNAYLDSNVWGDDKKQQLDNLDEFADRVQELNGFSGKTDVRLNAYLDSDIHGDDKETQLKNLDSFADAVEKLKAVNGNTEVRLNAYMDSDIWGEDKEAQLENLDEFASAAEKLKDLGGTTEVRLNAYMDSDIWGDKEAQLDNLPKFAEVFEQLKGKDGTTEVRLQAYLDSDVWGDKETQLKNLPKFIDVFDQLRDKDGTTEIHLKAYLDSDVWGDKETQLNNLPKYAEVAQSLQGVSSKRVDLQAYLDSDVWGDKEEQLDNLPKYAEVAQALQNVASKRVDIQAYLDSDVWGDKETQLNNLPKYAEVAQSLQGVSDVNVTMSAKIDSVADYDSINRIASFANAAQQLKDVSNVSVVVSATADIAAINNIKSSLQALSDSGVMKSYSASVTVTASNTYLGSDFTGSGKADMSAETKDMGSDFTGSGTVDMSPDSLDLGGGFYGSATINVKPNTYNLGNLFTGTATIKTKSAGGGGGGTFVNGTAFANGAGRKEFKHGDWGTKDSGTALMGELGQELIVRDGRFFTVGDNGAEFVKYRKNDIIFNHRQTEELFKNGYVTSGGGRGKAYVEGTAFANVGGGSWKPGGIKPSGGGYKYNVSSGKSKSTKSPKKQTKEASEEAEKFEEVLDLVEIAIDRIERAIKNLDTVASSTFRSWTERTSALNEQIAQTRNEIDLQQRSYERYMQAASEVGLDAGWVDKIQNGKVDIELITDENLKEKIDQYEQWYSKALDCRDAIIELTEKESQLYKQRFDNVSDKFEGYLGVIEHEKNMLDEFIAQSEAHGWITSQKYYEALAKNTNSRISELEKQRDEMTAEMNAAVDSGKISKGSEAWYEMVNEIDSVTLELEKANTELLEFQNNIRDIDYQIFELIQDRISGITEESDFLIDLMSNKKLYDDKGQLTDEGQASMGLHGVNYNVYMNQADQYAKKVAELNAQIAKDPYNQDLINKRDEYLEAQRESILNAEDEKNAIRDLVRDGIEAELDALSELIDKRNEALDNAKDKPYGLVRYNSKDYSVLL